MRMSPTAANRPRLRVSAALVAAVVLAGATLAAHASASPPTAGAKAADGARGHFAGLVKIKGGREIYLECRGNGRPTVVFESGAGNGADIWSLRDPGVPGPSVLPAVARSTRVCAYDRPGTALQSGEPSRSDPVPVPRSAGQMVSDLRALLRAAEVPGPYVLVGHSLGGALTRLYAGRYPGQVAGLVAVDAAHEDVYHAFATLFTPEQQEPFKAPEIEIDIGAIGPEMRRAQAEHPLRPMPMIVLEHSRDRQRFPNPLAFPPGYPVEEVERIWQAAQDDLATLIPHVEHIIARRSEHYIQMAQPDLVISAVRRIRDQLRPVTVRCRGGLSACHARVDLVGGASDKRVTIQLSDGDLRLVSVRPNRRSLRNSYGLSEHRLRRGGSSYAVTLDAAQSIPRGSHLTFTFRAIRGR